MNAPTKRVELLAERFEKGLDLFTGEPLTGEDKNEWTKLREETRGGAGFGITSVQPESNHFGN